MTIVKFLITHVVTLKVLATDNSCSDSEGSCDSDSACSVSHNSTTDSDGSCVSDNSDQNDSTNSQ